MAKPLRAFSPRPYHGFTAAPDHGGMKLKVHIDRDACLAYGDCAELAPEAFEVDDTAHLVGTAPLRKLVDAARACPSEAITLIDAETGEQIAP
jgi:ferredoxin